MIYHDALPMRMGHFRHIFLLKTCGNSTILAFLQRPRQQLAATGYEVFRCDDITEVNSSASSPIHELPPASTSKTATVAAISRAAEIKPKIGELKPLAACAGFLDGRRWSWSDSTSNSGNCALKYLVSNRRRSLCELDPLRSLSVLSTLPSPPRIA
ncbi:uncharacterized protein LACBIDRAFT_297617 [Laccaria bicolor S238N-H82]|uniref:Predicted protein n=1 Tax=Laccaria bicolor (strain S238N-H82 / ATCC MYA-4686) TaxID=486041 RepID=B0DBL7_LACBS|nr:uncharacterized protein LACBIDRAFT_297617 [Laccaria bicolor S238N-H82]EDR08205.1 predicted protein [Laccaria bicolor S238N-H82]|eukprot:XP_001881275.1 predicted protein [Laccaria bicolor S238N-H82]